MSRKKIYDYVLVVMKNLNLIVILYLAGIMAVSVSGAIRTGGAMELLLSAGEMVSAPWKLIILPLVLSAVLLLLLYIQVEGTQMLFWKICAETVTALLLSYVIGFSYMGMILLILADTLRYFPKSSHKFPVAIIICLYYLLLNNEFMVLSFDVTPLETYLAYFQADVRSILLGIQDIFASLNIFVFLIYMIVLLRSELNEKERIIGLNRQLHEANSELQKANLQLEAYAKEEEQMVATRERNRLAREIHDTLGHALTGIITGIEACTALMDVAPEAAQEQMKVIAEVARQGMTDVRRSVKALRPDALEKYSLEKALFTTVENMKKASHVDIEYRCDAVMDGFNHDEEDVIYRIVQEGITNAIRHGQADRIQIHISEDQGILTVRIKDNGKGCPDVKQGFGLHHMEERLRLLQGELHYNGENGFVIEAKIPIRWGQGRD